MHDPLGIVDQMVNLALQDRLEILLHLSACYFRDNGKGELTGWLYLIQVGTDDIYLSILDLIHVLRSHPFDSMGSSSTTLQIDILTPHPLALEGRTIRDRDGNRGDGHLQPSDLNRPLNDLIVGDVGDHVFVSTDAGR